MIVDLLILVICSLAITLLGLVIFVRNPSHVTNRRFAVLSFSLLLWSVFNFISDHSDTHVLVTTRLAFLGGILTAYSLLSFIANFPNDRLFQKSRALRVQALVSFLLIPLSLTPALIQAVEIDGASASISTGLAYNLFLFYVIFTLALLVRSIFKQYKKAKLSTQKQQVLIVSWGIILYAVLAIVSNVVLPLLMNNWSSSRFGPAFTLFLVGMVAYTIVKHRLFDIRLIVARSAAYILSIGFLIVLFSSLVFGVSDIGAQNNLPTIAQRSFYVLVTVILVITYPRLKSFFDLITNKLFYQDAYNAQLLLDTLNRVLVSTYKIDSLLNQTAEIIDQNLKSAYTFFAITTEEQGGMREFGSAKHHQSELDDIYAFVSTLKQTVIIADSLDEGSSLQRQMRKFDIAIIVKLASEHGERQDIGFMALSTKKSGNPYNKPDLQLLMIIANELVIAIQNALRFEEIENFNVTLQDEVEDATRRLRRTNEKLKALDETKDEFISMASHQLRTPLTAVKGYLSMVIEGDAGELNEMQEKLLTQAFTSSQRMVYLIADLLNVSRLRTGKFVIEKGPSNLADVIEGEISQLTETAKSRNIELIYNKPDNFPTLELDETKTRQVIMNFIDNAIYYGKAGGHIHINLVDTGQSIEFTVVDDGIGVPKSEQHHLFTKFYRAGNAKKARPDGTGLGLFMAKKVIVAQGGAILFHSQEGKGSTFGFTFEKAKLVPHSIVPKDEPVLEKAS